MTLPKGKQAELWFTLGPSSDDGEKIRNLLIAGATGIRLTFSYGSPEWHIEKAHLIKQIAASLGKNCYLIADLEGEKYRLGNFINPKNFNIKDGDIVILTHSSQTWSNASIRVPVKSPKLFETAADKDQIIVGDGSATLLVESKKKRHLITRAIGDGVINPNRGLAIQSNRTQPNSFTQKDNCDLSVILTRRDLFDAIALSFTSSGEDIKQIRLLMRKQNCTFPIIAKIETEIGLANIDSIAEEADCLLAARGDLALFTPWIELYGQIIRILQAAKLHGKDWVIATQIAEGMERFLFPTRAEICDLSHWLSLGANGVMLSYETAFGSKPKEAVQCVKSLIDRWSNH